MRPMVAVLVSALWYGAASILIFAQNSSAQSVRVQSNAREGTPPDEAPRSLPVINHDISKIQGNKVITIAFGSCLLWPNTAIWSEITKRRPDLMIFLGDNIYQSAQDFGKYDRILDLYRKVYGTPALAALIRATPTFAIWDDHDFGPNDSTSQYQHRAVSLQAFRAFWGAQSPPAGLPADTIAHRVDLGAVLVLMTDNRTFRTAPDSAEPAYFGELQLNWIERELHSFQGTQVVLASGGQLLTSIPYGEMLGAYPAEQRKLLQIIERSRVPVVILSGDKHHAEILRRSAGTKILREFTSSPLGAGLSREADRPSDPYLEEAFYGRFNFGLLSIDTSAREPKFAVQIISDDGSELFQASYNNEQR